MVKKRKEINWSDVEKHIQQPVLCTFWDHATGFEAIQCSCVGFLTAINETKLTLVSWDVHHEDPETRRNNMEANSIVKSCIIEILPLRISKRFG